MRELEYDLIVLMHRKIAVLDGVTNTELKQLDMNMVRELITDSIPSSSISISEFIKGYN